MNDKLKLLVGRIESFFPAPSAKTKFWPVGYVPASFRVPPGLLVADCFRFRLVSMSFFYLLTRIFRHWLSGWRLFQGKDLPPRDDGTSQKMLRGHACIAWKEARSPGMRTRSRVLVQIFVVSPLQQFRMENG